MVNIEQFKTNLSKYIHLVISRYASKNLVVKFFSPLIVRAANGTIEMISQPIRLIADKEGNIDVSAIMGELQQNLVNTVNFTVDLPVVGTIVVENGCIKIGIPHTNENLVFTKNDLIEMKEILTSKD